MPDPVPAALLRRLAIDQAWQGRTPGSALLRNAVLRVVGAAETIGVNAGCSFPVCAEVNFPSFRSTGRLIE